MATRLLDATRERYFRLKLAHKLTFLAVATSAPSMLVLYGVLVFLDESARRQLMVHDSTVLVEGLAVNNSAAIAFGDGPAAEQSLKALAAVDARVIRAAAYLQDGTALADYRRTSSARDSGSPPARAETARLSSPSYEFGTSALEVAAPVILEGQSIGAVRVEFSLDAFHAHSNVVRWTLGNSFAVSGLLAWLVGWRLQRYISEPLLRLAALTRTVSIDPSSTERATGNTHDEIGDLIDGFNAMLDHIQTRDVALAEERRGLEQAVAARTIELASSVDRFKRIVESTHAIPWEAHGESFALAYISPQVCALLAYDSAALVGTAALWDAVHQADREHLMTQLAELAAQPDGSGRDIDCRFDTGDGRRLDVRIVAGVHEDAASGRVLRGVFLDVTEQRRLERDLQQAQKLESVGRLAAGVAHEINTPVQFVSDSIHFVRDAAADLAKLIQSYRGGLDAMSAGVPAAQIAETAAQAEADADLDYLLDNVPKALERSLDGLNRVAVIVRSMKDFAHPDQTAMADVDLNRAIESTLVIARNEYKYVADIETDLTQLPLVKCHGGEINQVILNIVVNAAHAIGDVVRDTDRKGRITVKTWREGDDAVISIADTGGGIPESIRHRIFDPFFTTKGVGKGTGQGLAIARSVVHEKHGGRLEYDSEPGSGTTFTIRLPIAGSGRGHDGVAA